MGVPYIPDPGAQMVRYYGWYSNASRGKRRLAPQAAAAKASSDEPETEADGFSRARRQSWGSRLVLIGWQELTDTHKIILRAALS